MKALLLAAAAMGAAFPAAAQTVAVTNARLVIGDGSAPVEGGTVVVRDGRVVAAGAGVAVPAGVPVVDAGGRYVTPGLFAGFTRMGIVEVDGVSETDDSAASGSPFNAAIDVSPAVNPKTSAITVNRAEGITRAVVAPEARGSVFAGQGAIIDLGADMDAVSKPRAFQFMVYGEEGARRAGGSRPAAIAMLRNILFEVRDYARAPASFTDRGKDALLTRADAQALVPVVNGQVPLLVHVERASDILVMLDLKREVPALKLVLVGANEGWTVARQIAAAKVPVLASALADLPASFEQLAATQSNIGRMQAAGVMVGIGMINDDEARQARLVKQYAGNLVALTKVPGASGLDWGQAFATISSKPAEAMGVGGEYGSLRPGRRGDVVVWDGDPLEIGTAAVRVFIDGVEQPIETRQDQLRKRYFDPKEGALPKAYQR
ncbi:MULTISPECIES: amidohydrolase family protein [unclassified Sphingomonas]|uniref:amidohydrolase family protein n=1 Tax=unclassified Sphingomonas TaxID=196159 RepID=UPI002151135C|nr:MULTISPECIES: amidohydrolase family protein [unclassified Sphingomonas]MCR5872386.1 amidohydrolase family protein [Sphingomonas sp. J344]UUX99325.1 amidohydrolase family protein [Sphingomonas sp. J315]